MAIPGGLRPQLNLPVFEKLSAHLTGQKALSTNPRSDL